MKFILLSFLFVTTTVFAQGTSITITRSGGITLDWSGTHGLDRLEQATLMEASNLCPTGTQTIFVDSLVCKRDSNYPTEGEMMHRLEEPPIEQTATCTVTVFCQ